MHGYAYKAKHGPEKIVEGEISADSRADAIARLDRMGYSPIWVREKSGENTRPGGRSRRRRRISPWEVTIFTRQMASMLRSGVPILRALHTIGEQTENLRFSTVIKDVEDTIRDGGMLSGALARHPSLFTEFYISMVRAGEAGGIMDKTLTRLADAREKEEDLRRKIQAAVAYPALILAVGAVTVFVLLAFFMPRIIELFDDFSRLPLPTRILVGLSRFCAATWYWFLLIAGLAAVVVRRLASLEKGRTLFDTVALHVPVFGVFVRESAIARFASTLSVLLDSGVQIDRALDLAGRTMRNSVLAEEIGGIRRATVDQGETLSTGLRNSKYFPLFVGNMTAVGEEAGRIEESLSEISAFYEKQMDTRSRIITSLLEPVLILAVGAVVGFIVAAMLLPVFQISTTF